MQRRPEGPVRGQAAQVVAAGVALVGMLVVAGVAGGAGDGTTSRGPRLSGSLVTLTSDALTGAFLVAAGLMVALVAWVLWTAPRQGEPRRRPWWHQLVGLALLAVVTVTIGWASQQGWGPDPAGMGGQDPTGPGSRAAPPQTRTGAGGDLDPAHRRTAALVGAVLAALGGAAGLWWLNRGDVVPQGPSPDPARLRRAVEAALDDLDQDANPRAAVLRCFWHLDVALDEAGCPRRPSETAREHRRRAAAVFGPAAPAAARLVALFERARYDEAPILEDDRIEAEAALRAARAALEDLHDRQPPAEDVPAGTPTGTGP